MGRSPCCSKVGLRRGPWSTKEDTLLSNYIQEHGEGQWRSLPKKAGLLRCGKSCRLRWMNYLRPGIKRGNISQDEEDLIVRLHGLLGNRWSLIAGRLPEEKEAKETKVYLPKPIRVSSVFSRTNSYDSLVSGTSSSEGGVDPAEKVAEVVSYVPVAWPPLFELEDSDYGVCGGGGEDDFLGVGCIMPLLHHQSDSISGDVNMLEQVYDEYLQLL
ncbi:hypothetical protein Pfo_025770 [Paulownia fortunei]|nr:hypothetical protein Pfo_025770 [Paulownia fortunei]